MKKLEYLCPEVIVCYTEVESGFALSMGADIEQEDGFVTPGYDYKDDAWD